MTPPFSSAELASWRDICRQEVLYTLQKHDSWYYDFDRSITEPTPNGQRYELAMQQQDPPFKVYTTNGSPMHALMNGTMSTTLASFAHPFVGVESNNQRRAVLTHVFGDRFMDGGILQISERPTPEDSSHFVSVMRMAIKTLLTVREYLLFEVSGSLEDANGELVVFRVSCSMLVDDAKIGDLISSSAVDTQYVRGEMYATFLMRATDGGTRTDLKVQSRVRLGGKTPAWVASKLMHPIWRVIARLETLGVSKALQAKLTDAIRESPKQPAAKDSVSRLETPACRVCLCRKRRLTPTRVCAGCDRQVCKACTERLHFLIGRYARETMALRFCLKCVQEAWSASTYCSTGTRTDSGSYSSGNDVGSPSLD